MLSVVLLQQTFDLTDKQTLYEFAFNLQWQYALGIEEDTDASAYVSEKTVKI